MCGIVGAIAQRDVAEILLEGLKRLEYRGYDSAGIAVVAAEPSVAHGTIDRLRVAGKVAALSALLKQQSLKGNLGIAHTRWATHGQPTLNNAHPHCSSDQIAVVHNGIIENHHQLRQQLQQAGYEFQTQTDTEVVVHLLHSHLQDNPDMLTALQQTRQQLKGAYALGIVNKDNPHTLYAMRHGCPLVIGAGIGENFIASDRLALLPVTQEFVYLEEDDIAEVSTDQFVVYDQSGQRVTRELHRTEESGAATTKGNYRHFMLKEIFEQPRAISDTLEGHILGERLLPEVFGHQAADILVNVKRVHIVACGTSYHAGLVARHWLETIAGISCQVEVASEYRYRQVVVDPQCLFLTLSQSGETADTIAALRLAKQLPYIATASISNVAHSSLVRETDLAFLTRAGAEIGVAATKTFTAQLTALLMLTLLLAESNQSQSYQSKEMVQALQQLPDKIQHVLALDEPIQAMSKDFSQKHHALFLGRGDLFAIALEGALKLKEISYIHAEAYPAGELKHGPLALVDEEMPIVVIAPKNATIDKLESNLEEVQARGGQLYIFADERLGWESSAERHIIDLPAMPEILFPIVYTIPMQLLAYHIAVLKGTDVDQPRNLAKSVTVE